MRSEFCPIQFRKHIIKESKKTGFFFYHVENQNCLISWFSFGNRKNVNKATNIYQIDWKQVRNWLKDEEKIPSLKCSRKACRSGKAYIPVMEKELYTTFLDMQNEGKFVKR